jgi:uncharacterized beta-barrel protein YwiB (DUF1934 family)
MEQHMNITIEGEQLGTGEAPIVLSAKGICRLHNDQYYIQYDEVNEEQEHYISRIRISPTYIEMIKEGVSSSQISFDPEKETQAIYRTPYGDLCFEVKTSYIRIDDSGERIEVSLEYALFTGSEQISEHRTVIRMTPKANS